MELTAEQKKMLGKILEKELAEATGGIVMYPGSAKYYTERKKQLEAITRIIKKNDTGC